MEYSLFRGNSCRFDDERENFILILLHIRASPVNFAVQLTKYWGRTWNKSHLWLPHGKSGWVRLGLHLEIGLGFSSVPGAYVYILRAWVKVYMGNMVIYAISCDIPNIHPLQHRIDMLRGWRELQDGSGYPWNAGPMCIDVENGVQPPTTVIILPSARKCRLAGRKIHKFTHLPLAYFQQFAEFWNFRQLHWCLHPFFLSSPWLSFSITVQATRILISFSAHCHSDTRRWQFS